MFSDNLITLGIHAHPDIEIVSMDLTDVECIVDVLGSFQPAEIYHLSGQSSVAKSFKHPIETTYSIVNATLNLLEAVRILGIAPRIFNAGSGDCFGDTQGVPITEKTPFSPLSPYAVAKVAAHHFVKNYREAFGIFACTGFLFNHESPLRPVHYVTRKVIRSAIEISSGRAQSLVVGNMQVQRDWGWAPEYVYAMWLMLQQELPTDLIIATGKTVSLEYFIHRAFAYVGLDYRDYISIDTALYRPNETMIVKADPSLSADVLNWNPTIFVDSVIELMCESEINFLRSERPTL